MAVRVVKLYAATSDLVFVILESRVDFPTDGKPTSDILASVLIVNYKSLLRIGDGREKYIKKVKLPPDLETSKPVPALDEVPGAGSSSCARRRASLPFNRPRWYSVALFFLVVGS